MAKRNRHAAKQQAVKRGRKEEKKEKSTQETYSLDKMRNFDPTLEQDLSDDEEIKLEEKFDEFSRMFSKHKYPKILMTTAPKPRKGMFPYIAEFMTFMPNVFYYERKHFKLHEIAKWAAGKDFTHLVVLADRKAGVPHGVKKKNCLIEQMLVSCLNGGPTALFRVTNFTLNQELFAEGKKGEVIGTQSDHIPEVLLNGFGTKLGRRVSRILASLFGMEKEAEVVGRNTATFHCQRDFIFLRCHRYIFEKKMKNGKAVAGGKVRLQETGPRFTLKMKWLMKGELADMRHGEMEFVTKRVFSKDKKQFWL